MIILDVFGEIGLIFGDKGLILGDNGLIMDDDCPFIWMNWFSIIGEEECCMSFDDCDCEW